MKAPKLIRGKFADEKYVGSEPMLTDKSTVVDISNAYTWYRYFFDMEDSKKFTLAYLSDLETNKLPLDKIKLIDADDFSNIGWNCRILHNGGILPQPYVDRMYAKLELLISKTKVIKEQDVDTREYGGDTKLQECVGFIENEIDKFLLDNSYIFNTYDHLSRNNYPATISKAVIEYYSKLQSELSTVEYKVTEGFEKLSKKELKLYIAFIDNIISDCGRYNGNKKKVAKPRKVKIKTPIELTKKLKFLKKDDEYKLVSIQPGNIIGSNHLWTFNPKTKVVAHYASVGGLTVKGSKIVGFDESMSNSKKLRKPVESLKEIMETGKVSAVKYFDSLSTKPSPLTGSINSGVILLRVTK